MAISSVGCRWDWKKGLPYERLQEIKEVVQGSSSVLRFQRKIFHLLTTFRYYLIKGIKLNFSIMF